MTRALIIGAVALGLLTLGAQLAHLERGSEVEKYAAAAELALAAAQRAAEYNQAMRSQLLVEIAAREQAETALDVTLATCRPLKRGRR